MRHFRPVRDANVTHFARKRPSGGECCSASRPRARCSVRSTTPRLQRTLAQSAGGALPERPRRVATRNGTSLPSSALAASRISQSSSELRLAGRKCHSLRPQTSGWRRGAALPVGPRTVCSVDWLGVLLRWGRLACCSVRSAVGEFLRQVGPASRSEVCDISGPRGTQMSLTSPATTGWRRSRGCSARRRCCSVRSARCGAP